MPGRPFFLGVELLRRLFFGTHFGSEQSDIIGQLAGGFALAFTKSSFTDSRESARPVFLKLILRCELATIPFYS